MSDESSAISQHRAPGSCADAAVGRRPAAGNWSYPTRVWFGPGRVAELPDACRDAGISRPLLVTDPILAALGPVADAVAVCAAAGIEAVLFCEVRSNPELEDVEAGVAAYRAGGHDGVIAFGGGSALDTAKAVALMAGQIRPIWDFEDREDWWTRADADGIAPVVAVPTTSGTGSEVGRAAVITDPGDRTKKIIFHPRLMPTVVIADPAVTVGLPAHLTAAVGMDALSHSLEAWCSPVYHPMADGIALEGIRLVHDCLPAACTDGEDLDARAGMQVAAMMGATAFQTGLGAMHSLSHPCSSLHGTHHGLTNAVVMPYVLAFNRTAIESKLAALGRYLGLDDASYAGVLAWVLALRAQVGVPHTLADLGIPAADVPRMARMAALDPPSATNPIPVDPASLEALYHRALDGNVDRA